MEKLYGKSIEMSKPLVTVIICVYNGGEFLKPAVMSILNQTYSNIEVNIVDDGSTDDCIAQINDIRDDRLHILGQENQGRPVALNYALGKSSGQFYLIQDADDLSYPNRVEYLSGRLLEQPDLAAVFSGHDLILENKRVAPRFAPKDREACHRDIIAMRQPAHDPTAMFRISMVREIRYEPLLRIGAGWDYILRVGELHPMEVLGKCLYSYRINPSSNTRSDYVKRREMSHMVVERALIRRGEKVIKTSYGQKEHMALKTYRNAEYGLIAHFIESVLDLKRSHNRTAAFVTAFQCSVLHPFDWTYYKPMVFFLLPLVIVKWYRKLKN